MSYLFVLYFKVTKLIINNADRESSIMHGCYSVARKTQDKRNIKLIKTSVFLHTRDIHRPSPWMSSQAVGVAAGLGSSALMTWLCVGSVLGK